MNTPLFSFFNPRGPINSDTLPEKVQASWVSPSNIAIIKYWGKKEGQIPANPSLSMTLDKAVTKTSMEAVLSNGVGGLVSVNGDPKHPFLPKLDKLFLWLVNEIPPLQNYSFRVETMNTFPHSTGIASSASGISAFSLCMLSIAEKITGIQIPDDQKMKLASFISRIGSGSACRSVYGGFSLWGETPLCLNSSDEYAVPVNDQVHSSFRNLQDAILVISEKVKEISSSSGHILMHHHPFAENRIVQAENHFKELLNALRTGDFELLGKVAETEALTLHSLIMTSEGNPILFAPNTIYIIKKVQQVRKSGLPLFFTLDAGANVHLIYPETEKEKIEKLIHSDLLQYCENGKVIYDRYGRGPVEIIDN